MDLETIEKPLDVTAFTSAMIDEEIEKEAGVKSSSDKKSISLLFLKKPLLKISKLRLGPYHSEHVKENKLSAKMGRRDIQFYDVYKLGKPEDDVQRIQDKGYRLDGVLEGDDDDEG